MRYVKALYDTAAGKKKIRIILNEKVSQEEEVKTGYIGGYPPNIYVGDIAGYRHPFQHQEDISEERNEQVKDAKILRAAAIDIADEKIKSWEMKENEVPFREEDLKSTDVKYPLIPNQPKPGEKIYAYAHIVFDNRRNEVIYYVIEPSIDTNSRKMLENIKEFIQEKLDINFAQVRKQEAVKYIDELFERAIKYFRIKTPTDVLKYYVIRDFMGLGIIEPLMQDKNIEDVSCDGVNVPIYVYHRDAKLGSIKTSLSFVTNEELDSFVNKVSERCGKTISVAKPLLDGTLPEGSRVQATLGSDIARRGSNFTIRMFTEKPLTPVDAIESGTCDLKMMSYLWYLVEHDASILISGGTASGKTTLLNILSLFIRPQAKIVSIEDTAELRLSHSHWVPEVARTPLTEEGKVDMYELLRESLRQRPDYIIVGEVRGKEAYVLFQQMAVGHAGMATIHAENFPKLVDRLTTQPIGLPANLIQNLDVVIFVRRVKRGRKYSRRAAFITEVLGYDPSKNYPITNDVFKWNPITDSFDLSNKSAILRKIANATGSTENEIKEELYRRSQILRWMVRHKIKDYRKVTSIINLYYMSPEFLLKKIEGEL